MLRRRKRCWRRVEKRKKGGRYDRRGNSHLRRDKAPRGSLTTMEKRTLGPRLSPPAQGIRCSYTGIITHARGRSVHRASLPDASCATVPPRRGRLARPKAQACGGLQHQEQAGTKERSEINRQSQAERDTSKHDPCTLSPLIHATERLQTGSLVVPEPRKRQSLTTFRVDILPSSPDR